MGLTELDEALRQVNDPYFSSPDPANKQSGRPIGDTVASQCWLHTLASSRNIAVAVTLNLLY